MIKHLNNTFDAERVHGLLSPSDGSDAPNKSYVDQGDSTSVGAANAYTDQEVAASLADAKAYTDQEVAASGGTGGNTPLEGSPYESSHLFPPKGSKGDPGTPGIVDPRMTWLFG